MSKIFAVIRYLALPPGEFTIIPNGELVLSVLFFFSCPAVLLRHGVPSFIPRRFECSKLLSQLRTRSCPGRTVALHRSPQAIGSCSSKGQRKTTSAELDQQNVNLV